MDSAEFSEWLWAESRGELLDDYSRFGMVAAAVMNAGFRYPKEPVGSDAFRPKFETPEQTKEKTVKAFDKMTKRPDYSEFIWRT